MGKDIDDGTDFDARSDPFTEHERLAIRKHIIRAERKDWLWKQVRVFTTWALAIPASLLGFIRAIQFVLEWLSSFPKGK